MKRRSFIKSTGTAGLLTIISPSGIIQAFSQKTASALEEGFHQPPVSAFPQTWWHWMNGNVTKEGITLDLEAMKEIGVGGFQNFDAGTLIPKGPIVYLSPEWVELKKHTIKEAGRLGLEFTMHNCPGWSSSGGPWITPELAMQQLTWSEAYVSGGKQINTTLPQPFTKMDFYRDVYVLAYPSLPGEASIASLLSKAITSDGATVDLKSLTGENGESVTVRPVGGDNASAWLQLEFDQPFEARSLAFIGAPVATGSGAAASGQGGSGGAFITLESSNDGVQFSKVATINTGGGFGSTPAASFGTSEFPAVKAKFFRLTSAQPRQYGQLYLSGADRIYNWKTKANYTGGFWQTTPVTEPIKEAAKEATINPTSVLDLTQYVDKNGKLTWNAPAGNWTILRIGYTPMGTLNRSAPDTGIGLECDKYSRAAIDFHFNKMMENLIPALGPLAAKGKVGLLIDSWEVGMQNWTAGFEKEFQKRKGYNLLPYLPAMTGRVVDSVDTSERFLWDIRRTQADLLADNYYGRFAELCKQHGIISYTEPYDRGPMEEMQIGSRVEVNMGEFWNGLSSIFQNNYTMRRTTKLAASIAHINGQKVVGAESFTGEPESAKWQEYPFAMKPLGDKMFTQGLNRIIFHRYAHQPHPTALPGMTMGPWGIHFDRTNTWWKPGKAWMSYLSRCQYMLQQGLFVADLLYFTGEEVATYTKVYPDEITPTPSQGYDYDLINTETLLKRAKISNGRIVLPDGMSYRVLVLQQYLAVSLELLRKLHSMVKEGMVMIGAKPTKTLGLRDTNGDKEFNELITSIWGDITGGPVTENRPGAGRVFWGLPEQEVLNKINVQPDLEISSRSGDAPITYIHRRTNDAEIYFLANQRRKVEELVCTFRVNGKQPELWDPDTGKTTAIKIYDTAGERIKVPLQLGPSGSQFIVFRTPAAGRRLQSVAKDGKVMLGAKAFPATEQKLYNDVANNFTLSLWVKPEMDVMLSARNTFGGGEAWTDYYAIYPPSGEAIYGKGHETVGLTAGRNGVVIWTRGAGKPVLSLAAPTPISGWSHVAVVYKDGTPAIYVNGKLIQQGKASTSIMHPGIGQAHLSDGASYYNGDMTEPQLFAEPLSEERIRQLAETAPPIKLYEQSAIEISAMGTAGLLFWENDRYTLQDSAGSSATVQVSGISNGVTLSGPWQISFPPDRGAPAQITLPELISLHRHSEDGVKYFSGIATYRKDFTLLANSLGKDKHLFLDLGRVEVMAQVILNGKDLGILWKRPYKVDITEAVKVGTNRLEVKVTNLWPNRLIGDEQVSEMYKFPSPSATTGPMASLSGGGILELPDWYKEGKPKPNDNRVTFTTWKHYKKDSPLLESGLIGPVVLRTAVFKTV
ncbi:MAG: glycosyl hydrolase family 43 [Flavisolibacter sp.]|nr:glycosyl hydrolase family 43 [Flavisolibacter sp.]